MKCVSIPFKEQFGPAMLSGQKTMTCRTRRYGWAGDTFLAFGATFQLLRVYKIKLGRVAEGMWAKEGCESPGNFKAVWQELHPTKGYDPEQVVYAHEFARVGKW